ncbi:MAG: histidine--tRNA ligase [Actinobacteria bacterium]|nr:histidine--tRNA ligase [Actinomycetota bacterium]
MKFQAPKGVSEYFPPRSSWFERVIWKLEESALAANYRLIETPIFEDTELFARGVGETTDVVSKEMYTFEDRGGRSITLRPEGTAGVIRSIIENGLDRGQLPVKVFYTGPFFRAERPQAGRYRQFFQFGIEAVGVDDPALDAEVISVAHLAFQKLGLVDYQIQINSLGDQETRSRHKEALLTFLRGRNLDQETMERAEKNPLRIFDDKRGDIQKKIEAAPLLSQFLSPTSIEKFQLVKNYLNQLQIPFAVNDRLVRGLDYYTGTTFEFVHNRLGAQSTICGGGRYDGLMETLGGQALSGIGFGLGIDRTLLALESEGVELTDRQYVDIYIIPIGETSRNLALELAVNCRRGGFVADIAFGDRGLKGSMKAADKIAAHFVLVLGDDELSSGLGRLKRMSDGEEFSVSLTSLVEELRAFTSR